ncbi:NUDIX hydrolase [Micromonospora sp. AMSO12t]|nr:NUDIX hydrolase [Micromonospora sp. AMSO12t]
MTSVESEAPTRAPVSRVQLVIGIVRRGDEILLVRESLGANGEMLWSLPGGGVQDGEVFHEALRREMQEETGLVVGDPVATAFVMHIDSERYPSALAIAFEINDWEGETLPEDDEIAEAAFFPLPEALKLIGQLESDNQREPILGYLTGEVPAGTTWIWRNRDDREVLLGRW